MPRPALPRPALPIAALEVAAYRVPTDGPESDGTFAWEATTVVVVQVRAGDCRGLGYSYTDRAAAELIHGVLRPRVEGGDALGVTAAWQAMVGAVRNLGRPGLASCAIAAVDTALWDLKARLLDLPLADLLGGVRGAVPLYGSGGFTNYSPTRLVEQLEGWAGQGIRAVKIKVGSDPAEDPERVRRAREAVGAAVDLYVDANGAYRRHQALDLAQGFARSGVGRFEEPVSSDDLAGLRLLRDRLPPGMAVAAGEYGYDTFYFRRMLEAGAVDVLQADATRCAGFTGLFQAEALARAHGLPLSAHTAPTLHLHPACALPALGELEWFHDHVRIESLFFDGFRSPRDGLLAPDLSRPGLGLELKAADAAPYAL